MKRALVDVTNFDRSIDRSIDKSIGKPGRRRFLRGVAGSGLAILSSGATLAAVEREESAEAVSISHRRIPASGESIPAIGMGTWLTFDVADVRELREQRADVVRAFFDLGGRMIDSSPMYGQAEEVIGDCLNRTGEHRSVFAASKIWTPIGAMGPGQLANSEHLWGVPRMDLMFVHNLLAWEKHLPRLQEWKREGRIRYVGVTTSHGRRHEELESVMRSQDIDFVQLTYNIDQIQAAERLLPLAADRGIAVVVNRPFQRGHLFVKYANRGLPPVAAELGCENWAQYLLLYVVSHPAVTCAIPATRRVDHMIENMRTLRLPPPSEEQRREMRAALEHDTG